MSTYTSDMGLSVPYVAGEMLDAYKEFTDTPEFQQSVTYRRFVFSQNPITGDLDLTVYADYAIYATVDIMNLEHSLVEAGELEEGDAEVFLPPRIRTLTSGTLISPEFRPQINDYIIFSNVTYRIQKITFETIGTTEVFARASCKRLQSTNPVSDFNANYDTSDYNVGGGYS